MRVDKAHKFRFSMGRNAAILTLFILSACSVVKLSPLISTDATVTAVSPSSVELKWVAVSGADRYQIFSPESIDKAVLETTFTHGSVSKLDPGSPISLTLATRRGHGPLTPQVAVWNFTTWPDFAKVQINTTLQNEGSTLLSWSYHPWNDLPGTSDAENALVVCSISPVGSTAEPISTAGSLSKEELSLDVSQLIPYQTYDGTCEAQYIDGTSSKSSNHFLIQPSITVQPCKSQIFLGQNFICKPNVVSTSANGSQLAYTLAIDHSNTCKWASVSPAGDTVTGAPGVSSSGISDQGSCTLAYTFTIPSTGYTSGTITTKVSVDVPPPYQIFPSFAVRAMPGALAYPVINSALSATPSPSPIPDTAVRARISADLITDFGFGSGFFAGGNAPFIPPNSKATNPTAFYGFTVSQELISGSPIVTKTGSTIDATREFQSPSTDSTSGDYGFARGNLLVPEAAISNTSFLSQVGSNSPVSLYNFLTNPYTLINGSVPLPALSSYLTTGRDFPLSDGTTNASSTFRGKVYQLKSVKINPPLASTILKYLPATTINDTKSNGSVNSSSFRAVGGAFLQGLWTKTSIDAFNPSVSQCDYKDLAVSPSENRYPHGEDNGQCASTAGAQAQFICEGDVIITAPLLLVDAVVHTSDKGCRLYVTGTVFVQGSLVAINDKATRTGTVSPNSPGILQIASSSAIIFGFSKQSLCFSASCANPTDPRNRPTGLSRLVSVSDSNASNPFLIKEADDVGSAMARMWAIQEDARKVGLQALDRTYLSYSGNPLISIVSPNEGKTATGDKLTADGHTYSGLVLSAPYIFSNYSGVMTGAIIAEMALFSNLQFVADPNLVGVPYFPMLEGLDSPLIVSP